VLAVSVETAEKSDVVCSCDSKCDVSPTVDESDERVTLESPVDTDSDAPVNSSEVARVACEAVVVSETCGRLVGDSVDGGTPEVSVSSEKLDDVSLNWEANECVCTAAEAVGRGLALAPSVVSSDVDWTTSVFVATVADAVAL